jgi:hypothetical protein
MKYVYQLEIEGTDGLVGDGHKSLRTSTVFTSERDAEKRIPKAKQQAIEPTRYGTPLFCPDFPVHVTVRKLEIIYDESWLKRLLNLPKKCLTYFSR